MRCAICDRGLSEKEIVYNDDLPGFEPCTECLEIALEAAYSGQREDDEDDIVLMGDFDNEYYRYIHGSDTFQPQEDDDD